MDKETGKSLGRRVTADGLDVGLVARAADVRAQALPPKILPGACFSQDGQGWGFRGWMWHLSSLAAGETDEGGASWAGLADARSNVTMGAL